MANGDIIKETREALERGNLSTKAASMLILTLLLQHTEEEKRIWEDILPRLARNQVEISELKKTNIVVWTRNHPRLSLGLFIGFIVITAFLDWNTLVAMTAKIHQIMSILQ